ncbi:hypothetical protein PaecuDRAFT_3121 [Paenibacillus curdlanolyticus YK9]|uniref:Uncharacterized protein n=1 Tax=Paenibacillus curdlanolyticus YK9 TaxID=717606 RepID=E0IBT2_9BACL|nr:hypothetical protein [Paenibacillus curdlanolyticus]EFM10162.1 hypothetical protein PaecuDRAFT_3121 [Paenibacillus curdlanolyticus YK9]
MFEYNICTKADDEIFNRQCLALEKHIPGLIKRDLLVDVDDSQTQHYELEGGAVTVHNDRYVDAVYVKAETDIEKYFT